MSAFGTVAGALLAITGAILPWLTLDAGLQRYNGTIGPYGWVIVAAGILVLCAGLLEVRIKPLWLAAGVPVLGCALLGFTAWLILGLQQVLHRPDSAMFVPQAGPGLFVILGGAILIVASPLVEALAKSKKRAAH